MTIRSLGLCAALLCLTLPLQAQTLERVRDSGVFTIAHRETSIPFSFVVPGQTAPQGLSVALCQRIAEAVKAELKLKSMRIAYLPVSSSTRIEAIQQGKADIECGSTTDNLARREQVAFSHHHFFATVQFLATAQGPKDWRELEGKTVVFTAGTSTRKVFETSGVTRGLQVKIVEGKDHAESFAMVAEGKADAFVLEDVLLASLRAQAVDPKRFAVRGQQLAIEPYALMLRKDDAAFQRLVNRTLVELMRSGEYRKLYRRWFESPIPPKNINLELPPGSMLREQLRKPSSVIPS